MFAVHPFIIGPGHDMPAMPDDGVDEKQLPVVIPVGAPWIGSAFGNDFKAVGDWMKAPNAGVQSSSLLGGCSRRADVANALDPLSAIQPSIRAKLETVGNVVP